MQKNPLVTVKSTSGTIATQPLGLALQAMLAAPIARAAFHTRPLQGGTLGDVLLITGNAETHGGQTLPFRMVQKTQTQWIRPGDPDSWSREYILSQSPLSRLFTQTFRAPVLYHALLQQGTTQLWMEYIAGRSGTALSAADLEQAAYQLGRFQGLCSQHMPLLQQISGFSDSRFPQREFAQWNPATAEYQCLHSKACPLPGALQQLLIDTQRQSGAIYQRLQAMPQVLCHRDFWIENIILHDGCVVVLDWDCAGWGAPGEDIASLIADETDPALISSYYHQLVPAYQHGLAQTLAAMKKRTLPIRDMILLKFGYRLLQQVMYAKTPDEKQQAMDTLEAIRALP